MQGMTSAQDSNTDLRRLNEALDKGLELFCVWGVFRIGEELA